MRLIDVDAFLADESEAYMNAQMKLAKENADKTIDATRYINQVVHKKLLMLIADTPTIDLVTCGECCKRLSCIRACCVDSHSYCSDGIRSRRKERSER